MSFILPYFKDGPPENRHIKLQELLVLPSEKKYEYYLRQDDWKSLLEQLSGMLLQRSAVDQEQDYRNVITAWLAQADRVSQTNLSQWSSSALSEWFHDFSQAYSHFAYYAFTPWAIDEILAPRLLTDLQAIDPHCATAWFDAISTPTRPNRMTQERIDLLRLALEGKESDIDRHTKKYDWLPIYNLGDPAWTKDDFQKRLEEINNPATEHQKIIKAFQQRQKDFERALSQIRPNAKLERLIDVVHLYTILRDERVDDWRIVLQQIFPFYRELAKRGSMTTEDATHLFDEEIQNFLHSKNLPPNFEKRKDHHAILFRNGVIHLFVTDDDIQRLRIQELGNAPRSRHSELRGFGAYHGTATGMARVVREPKDLSLLQDGEILIAHHTSPDYILAMKRSAVIVTDEGGITSHAAIISRELKIPCVTATGEASSMIQTGDEIEVNANDGIVRILHRRVLRKK
jgi:phosphohistidine swiveling domain-containing protein